MRHVLSVRVEALEDRKLLSRAHHAVAHPAPAAATPVVIAGTLSVNDRNGGTSSLQNPDGSTTTSVPITGQLGALGKVRGVWNENFDAYGDHVAPDVLRLQNAKGTLIVTFDNTNAGPIHPDGHKLVEYTKVQRLYAGTGAYVHATETGTIEVVANSAETVIDNIILSTKTA